MHDMRQEITRISVWIKNQVAEAGARGTVVGLSGGIDSAVVAGLCARAFPDDCLGVLMPCHSNSQDAEFARQVAEVFDLPTVTVSLDAAYDALVAGLEGVSGSRMALANIKPRLRMTTLYYFASDRHYLVAGTSNLSEMFTGYFTKYGDGGVDFEAIGHLVKTEVREMAKILGVPEGVINRPPTAGLWENQTDESEMGITYEQLDHYILTGEAQARVRQVAEQLHRASGHKRQVPPVPSL